MEQHPIPQQISSYEFRLIGDMTLKQFAQLAAGIGVAFLFYVSPFPWYLKWPVIIFFASLGTAMAFLPFEERPLHVWILAFFKAIYSPTQFIWQKNPPRPEIFEEKPASLPSTPSQPVAPADRQKLNEYLSTLPSARTHLDESEEDFLGQIKNLFSSVPAPMVHPQPQPSAFKPTPEPVRLARPWVVEEVVPRAAPRFVPPTPTRQAAREARSVHQAKFAPEIPMPSIPEIPNLLVGMVLDAEGKMVEGAIIEIRDSKDLPVRALRTNKLGQFRIATPLPNDTYEMEIEKDGLEFDIFQVKLEGKIVMPIEMRAK